MPIIHIIHGRIKVSKVNSGLMRPFVSSLGMKINITVGIAGVATQLIQSWFIS